MRRIEYDRSAGSAYIYFEEIRPGAAVRQIAIPGGLIFDLAKDGRVLGLEIQSPALTEGLTQESVVRDLERARIPVADRTAGC